MWLQRGSLVHGQTRIAHRGHHERTIPIANSDELASVINNHAESEYEKIFPILIQVDMSKLHTRIIYNHTIFQETVNTIRSVTLEDLEQLILVLNPPSPKGQAQVPVSVTPVVSSH